MNIAERPFARASILQTLKAHDYELLDLWVVPQITFGMNTRLQLMRMIREKYGYTYKQILAMEPKEKKIA